MNQQSAIIALAERYGARIYDPLPVVLTKGEGVFVWDSEGRRYLDCLSAYSALNQGHRHPRILAALLAQSERLTLTSRAFHNDRLGGFLEKLCRFSEMEMALPMNTGAEAVETAIKLARKWGYEVKDIADDEAEILVCGGNFHGRTTTVVSASSEPEYRRHFGPFTPGFRWVPFGDLAALEAAIGPRTAAFLLEPIQGENGVVVPPAGYLAAARRLCRERNVLFMLDEIQTGLGRTGRRFCWQHEPEARPDVLILGKALGGGLYPLSAVLASRKLLGLFRPGDHGSTFGGNPLAAAVGEAALDVLVEERLAERAEELGGYLMSELKAINSDKVREVRGRGLLIGVEIGKEAGPARPFCEALLRLGVLAKDTHGQVIRLAPPLVIDKPEIDVLVRQLRAVLS